MIWNKYFDIWLRWTPHLTKRQQRRLESLLDKLPDVEVEVIGRDGLEAQARWPEGDQLTGVLDAVAKVRGTTRDVTGAIVPRGYGWSPLVDVQWPWAWWATRASERVCEGAPLFRGVGHELGCDCPTLSRRHDVNTIGCVVAQHHAETPPKVVIEEAS